jgi:hypothetical protein
VAEAAHIPAVEVGNILATTVAHNSPAVMAVGSLVATIAEKVIGTELVIVGTELVVVGIGLAVVETLPVVGLVVRRQVHQMLSQQESKAHRAVMLAVKQNP